MVAEKIKAMKEINNLEFNLLLGTFSVGLNTQSRYNTQTNISESKSVYHWHLLIWIVHTVTIKYTKPCKHNYIIIHGK